MTEQSPGLWTALRAGAFLVGGFVVGVTRALGRAVVRTLRWAVHRWRASLQFRVVTATVLLCMVVLGLLQVFLYQRIADGLVQDRMSAAQDEAAAGTRDIQNAFDTTDKSDRESIRQLAIDLLRRQEARRGESTRELILMRGLDNPATSFDLPTLDTGLDAQVVPADVREALRADPGHQQLKIVSIQRDSGSTSAVLVGVMVRVPEAGSYELYFVNPLDRQEQILAMVRRTFLLGVVIFAVLVGLVAHVVTRLVVDPVREAALVADRLANGRLNERLSVRGEDDLAKLGTAFNAMADTVQAQISRLEDLSAVQQRFVSDVSHELRTPLTTIRMATEVIHDGRSAYPPTEHRSAEILHDEVERFDALLSDLLEISRFDAGAANLDRENADLRDIVDRVLTGTRELARHKGSELRLIGAEEPVRAEMDPRRVERIIRNLVVNALEHGEGGPVEVELGANDTAIAVAVRDHGIGLRPGEADLVFTRFWRGDPARKRTTGGTGLGLAISLEDARLHDGWLQAWGEPGEGSRFRLTLPRVAGRPIGYAPLALAEPSPDAVVDGVPVGEPIRAAGEPVAGSVPTVGIVPLPAQSDASGGESSGREASSAGWGEDPAESSAAPAPDAGVPAETDEPGEVTGPDEAHEVDELDRMPDPAELAELEGLAELEAEARLRAERGDLAASRPPDPGPLP